MRITFLVPSGHQNGGNRVIATHARNLLAMGHDVRIVLPTPRPRGRLETLRRALRTRSWPRPRPQGAGFFEAFGERLIRTGPLPLEAEAVPDGDVVIATFWRTAFTVAALPPEKGAKVYFVQHHEVHDHLPQDLAAGSYWLPLKKITISDWLVETMARLYGDTDVAKVPNSVDLDQFDAPPRARNARPRVGFVYSQRPFKGTDLVVRAIEIARRRFSDLEVVAFGGYRPDAALPLPPGTEFHHWPAQELIPKLYASCDAWLFGSRAEGFGLPILEALACRTPVVATRAGAAPDFIREGENGHLVEIEDAEALGARLVDLLSRSPEDWKAMSEAARESVRSYTWEDASRDFAAALARIAGHG